MFIYMSVSSNLISTYWQVLTLRRTQTQTSQTPVVSSVFILGSCTAQTEDFLFCFVCLLKNARERQKKKSLSSFCFFSWQPLLIMKSIPWDSKQKGKYYNLMSCTPVQTLLSRGVYFTSVWAIECPLVLQQSQASDQIQSIICSYLCYWSKLSGQIELALLMETNILSVSNWFKVDICTQ